MFLREIRPVRVAGVPLVDNPKIFVSYINKCLDKNSIWILQISYTPLMMSLNSFDNIIHEHIEYYTLESLIPLFKKFKLEIEIKIKKVKVC